jgi:hypothetical protein
MTEKVDIPSTPNYFPLTPMIETGLWAALTPAAGAVLGVIWDFHRRYPDACHPSRERIARDAGVSPPTVTRAVRELEDRGLLEVIAAHGLGANTYVVRWAGINLPRTPTRRSPRETPFRHQADEDEVFLSDDPDSRRKVVVSRSRERRRHVMADGCVLFSGREATLHEWLQHWRIPHFSSVPYHLLGVRGLHPSSTVDFLVAPTVIVEVWGLPSSQKSARSYNEKRKKKEAEVKKAGWTLLGIEPGKGPTEALYQPICDSWANSTIEQALDLLNRLRRSDSFTAPAFCVDLWEEHIGHAMQRRAGTKQPATPRGFYEVEWVSDGHGGRYDKRTPTRPQVYLEVSAGRVAVNRTPLDEETAQTEPRQPMPVLTGPAHRAPEQGSAGSSMKLPDVFVWQNTRDGDPDQPSVSEEVLDEMQRLEDRIGELEDLLEQPYLDEDRRRELEDALGQIKGDLAGLRYGCGL